MMHINVSHVPHSCSNAQCPGKCQVNVNALYLCAQIGKIN